MDEIYTYTLECRECKKQFGTVRSLVSHLKIQHGYDHLAAEYFAGKELERVYEEREKLFLRERLNNP